MNWSSMGWPLKVGRPLVLGLGELKSQNPSGADSGTNPDGPWPKLIAARPGPGPMLLPDSSQVSPSTQIYFNRKKTILISSENLTYVM